MGYPTKPNGTIRFTVELNDNKIDETMETDINMFEDIGIALHVLIISKVRENGTQSTKFSLANNDSIINIGWRAS